jgi:3-methyl-2-oxobutanoate hydroxymethyltransferase
VARELSQVTKVRVQHIAQAKAAGEKTTMLTAYDQPTAAIFDAVGVDMLLVGDSMGNAMLGYDTTLPVTLDDIARATAAVARGAHRALIVADLPFGTYEPSPERCFDSAAKLMRAGAHAVKLEGGARVAPQINLLTRSGIPVMAHLGFTPQSVNALGGNRVQGREAAQAAALTVDAEAVQAAGAFAIVLEMIPAFLAAELTARLAVPTVGIGAGAATDGQVLVWTDMAGLTGWAPKFARRFGEVGAALGDAARAYAEAVRDGAFPGPEHQF